MSHNGTIEQVVVGIINEYSLDFELDQRRKELNRYLSPAHGHHQQLPDQEGSR